MSDTSSSPAPRSPVAFPACLELPGGQRAGLVEGSVKDGKPIYMLDGIALDIDVTIPDDLIAAGWFWFGSYLSRCADPTNPNAILSIHTALHPPPSLFAVARSLAAPRAAVVATTARKRRPLDKLSAGGAVGAQMAMEL